MEPPVESGGLPTPHCSNDCCCVTDRICLLAKSIPTPKVTHVGEDAKFGGFLQCSSLKHNTLRTIRYPSSHGSVLCSVVLRTPAGLGLSCNLLSLLAQVLSAG